MKALELNRAELWLCARMLAARLGWPGFLGIVLILSWGFAEFVWLPRQHSAIERRAAESRALRREIVRLNREGERNLGPQARLAALLADFPARQQLPDELAKLNTILATAGVRVDRAEYQHSPDSARSGDFSAVNVTVVVKLPYPQLRALFASVRQGMPTVAIDDVQLKRDSIASTEAEARLRFKIFLRQQA